MKLAQLRTKYPKFFYRGYSYKLKGRDLHISFDFMVPARRIRRAGGEGGSSNIRFAPKVVIKNVGPSSARWRIRVKKDTLDNLVFHLGMMELPSYWKATCSPTIVVEAGMLNTTQITWWKNLFIQGLGEFFYQNKIDFTKPSFLTIIAERVLSRSAASLPKSDLSMLKSDLGNRVLVPVGGGKDSAVTLELLKNMKTRSFALNPKSPQLAIIKKAGGKAPITVLRTIDPKLLELNKKGFLNGHTPFSAYLAFLSTLAAVLFNFKYIALSNERSSNEGNVQYKGKMINHQYSKSFDFEQRFRKYSKQFLLRELEYFSFLRPLSELQIARIFSRFPKYFPLFLSCNKTKSRAWCGACAKCLFVYIILSPFVAPKALETIFKKNLLKNKSLMPIMDQLTGKRGFKPFECVGTPEEVNAALSLLSRAKDNKKANKILRSWNNRNFVPPTLARLLKESLA